MLKYKTKHEYVNNKIIVYDQNFLDLIIPLYLGSNGSFFILFKLVSGRKNRAIKKANTE